VDLFSTFSTNDENVFESKKTSHQQVEAERKTKMREQIISLEKVFFYKGKNDLFTG
jgi:hypothetical protein